MRQLSLNDALYQRIRFKVDRRGRFVENHDLATPHEGSNEGDYDYCQLNELAIRDRGRLTKLFLSRRKVGSIRFDDRLQPKFLADPGAR